MFASGPHVSTWGRALTILAAVAFLVLTITGPANEICFGAQGHFSIEPAHAQCPTDLAPSGASSAPGGPSAPAAICADTSSDTCSDVSLRIDLRPVAESRATIPAPHPVTACVVAHTISVALSPVTGLARIAATGPRRPPNLAPLRTVVLRC